MFPFHHSSDGNLKRSQNLCSLVSFRAPRVTSKPEVSPSKKISIFPFTILAVCGSSRRAPLCAADTSAGDLHILAGSAAVVYRLLFSGEPGRCVRSMSSAHCRPMIPAVADFQVCEGLKVPPARLVVSLAHFLISMRKGKHDALPVKSLASYF